ncbi:hypothetical protein BSM4216_2300 [Bacillus smithii]|nr:hypothetical protein BSM4216_2300 [Bacillus smithii]
MVTKNSRDLTAHQRSPSFIQDRKSKEFLAFLDSFYIFFIKLAHWS